LPPNGNELSDISFDELKKWDDRECGQKLVKFKETLTLEYKKPISGEDNAAYMVSKVTNGNECLIIWLKIAKDKCYGQSEIDKLNFLENDMVTFVQRLKKFNAKSCISNIELDEILSPKKNEEINTKRCHYDFHCGNVLVSNHYSVFIDLVDADFDLDASDIARLHVASWYELSRELKISHEDAKIIRDEKPNLSHNSSSSTFHYFSYKLENILENFIKEKRILADQFETSLAYVIQILMFQRYSILDGKKIPDAFDVFASHWITRLRGLCAKTEDIPFIYITDNTEPEWKPFFSSDNTIDNIVTKTLQDNKFSLKYNITFNSRINLNQKIKDAQNKNAVVVIIMDAWNLQQADILRVMQQCDTSNYYNCVLLITFDLDNKRINTQYDKLQRIVKDVFQNSKVKCVKSEHELKKTLVTTICEVNLEIIRQSEYIRTVDGKAPGSSPKLLGNDSDKESIFTFVGEFINKIKPRKNKPTAY
jgi:hypothetical protein